MQRGEMDERVAYLQQLEQDRRPVVLINQFNVAREDVDRLVEVWANDAGFTKPHPGLISTQLHRATAGSTTFVNVAVWESARALGQAFRPPEFQRRSAAYPRAPSPRRTCSKRSRCRESA
jgi:quinol monooxygenase YgiN